MSDQRGSGQPLSSVLGFLGFQERLAEGLLREQQYSATCVPTTDLVGEIVDFLPAKGLRP